MTRLALLALLLCGLGQAQAQQFDFSFRGGDRPSYDFGPPPWYYDRPVYYAQPAYFAPPWYGRPRRDFDFDFEFGRRRFFQPRADVRFRFRGGYGGW